MLAAIFGPNGSLVGDRRAANHAGYVLTIRLGDRGTVVNIERQRLQRLRDIIDQALSSAS